MSARALPNPSSPNPLHRLTVRPIQAGEREVWDSVMATHHYRGFRTLVGQALRYVAEIDGQWVAVLGWQSAARKCRPRDQWIGWSAVVQHQRLHLIANNARFLILPAGQARPNLASRVLALNLKRLAEDWQQTHGHPVVMAETFVETPRFTGACYRAANWQEVGTTRGYARHPHGYRHHGTPKRVLVYPLHRHSRRWLAHPQPHPDWSQPMQPVQLSTAQMADLRQQLRALPDYRNIRGLRHPAPAVLTIAIAAVLAGHNSFQAMAEWAGRLTQAQLKRLRARFNRQTRRFEPPSEPTLRRLLKGIDAEALDQLLAQWLMGCLDNANGESAPTLAVDGKTAKGAQDAQGNRVHLLSGFLAGTGVTVGQCTVESKTNEIPALRSLLKPLAIAGHTVTADALHAQRSTAQFLVEDKKAHYLFPVKENQPRLLADLQALPWGSFPPRG